MTNNSECWCQNLVLSKIKNPEKVFAYGKRHYGLGPHLVSTVGVTTND